MKIETYEQRILIPELGYWLYNAEAKVISDKVYLGKNANPADWVEISEDRKEELEKEWEVIE